jgi:hypothetical protein
MTGAWHHDHPDQRPADLDKTYGIESMRVAGGMGMAMRRWSV